MKTYVAIQERLSYSINWETIYCPNRFRLMMITNQRTYDCFDDKQKQYFNKIYIDNDLTYDSLSGIIQKVILEKDNENVEIVTNEEFQLLNCAKIREKFNLPGDREDVLIAFRHKGHMKKRLVENGLAHLVPRFKIFDPEEVVLGYVENLIDTLGLPIFCKPTAEAASKGTCVFRTKQDILSWIEKSQEMKAGDYEFDEFINGELYHCDSLIKDNQILFAQVSRYMYPCFDFGSGKPCASIVVRPDDEMFQKIQEFNAIIMKGFKMVSNCATHLEIFRTPDERLMFVEIAARPPGVLVCPTYEIYTGLDLKVLHYKLQMGLNFDLHVKKGPYTAWAMFPKAQHQVIKKINYPETLQSKYYFEHEVGIDNNTSHSRKNLWLLESNIMLWNNDYDVLSKDFDSLKIFIPVESENV